MFCSVKDKIPSNQKSNVIYTIKSPGCAEDYVGKTDRCVITRLNEHSTVTVQISQYFNTFNIVRSFSKQ